MQVVITHTKYNTVRVAYSRDSSYLLFVYSTLLGGHLFPEVCPSSVAFTTYSVHTRVGHLSVIAIWACTNLQRKQSKR